MAKESAEWKLNVTQAFQDVDQILGRQIDELAKDLQDREFPPEVRQLGRTLKRWRNQIVAWQAVVAGLGIGVCLEQVAARATDLVHVLQDVKLPSLPLWITAHRELRGVPRLKVVFDALAAALAAP
jgi:uncharacterized membrane-anchored protein YhcB (DUF1043 family)